MNDVFLLLAVLVFLALFILVVGGAVIIVLKMMEKFNV